MGNSSATSRTLDLTLTPVWDETFIMDCVLPDDPAAGPIALQNVLPTIVVECYDHDEIVRIHTLRR